MFRWPSSCAVCSRWPSQAVCGPCLQTFGRQLPRCPGCALLLAPGLERCARCVESPLQYLDGCVARVDYSYPWDGVVARLKFQGQPGWARHMARWMLDAPEARRLLADADCLVPVPLSPSRLASRGYNQAWELLLALRAASGSRALPLADALRRAESGRLQHDLSRQARADNAHRVLRTEPRHHAALSDARVLLIDDVMTTGATLEAAAQRLRAAGARSVAALVFARTPAPRD